MVAKVLSFCCNGLDIEPVDIEVDVSRGLPAINLVGLLDTAVKESRDRVRSALKNSGYEFPSQRITINLAPADLKKEGTHFDLAIALGIIAASGQAKLDLTEYAVIGEVSLEGNIRPVRGIFPMALEASFKNKRLIIPQACVNEASLVKGLEIFPVESLTQAIAFLTGLSQIKPYIPQSDCLVSAPVDLGIDFSDVRGQVMAKRALEVAVCGMHNVLMLGAPGCGKTMLASRLPTILPDMETSEIMEITKIYSIAGLLNQEKVLVNHRPFRSPHHSCSSVALVGGGTKIRPGEITLAHKGVLFLDELAEFSRPALEALRQPMEEGIVHISRASRQMKFPARFLFAAAMNPCPCGYFGSKEKPCHCSSPSIQKYRKKISGPLLDRVDIHVELSPVKAQDLMSQETTIESSAQIKQRVETARKIQQARLKPQNILFNSQMNHRQIKRFCPLSSSARATLENAVKLFGFSARAYDKILKVSRTIADLAGVEAINSQHISEAVQYRSLDKNLWV